MDTIKEIKNGLKQQIRKIEDKLIEKEAGLKLVSNEIKVLTEKREKLKKKLNNFKNKDFITDHCVIRYLERFKNLDFDKVRKEITETKGLKEAILIGASGLKVDDKEFIIRGGKVITIY